MKQIFFIATVIVIAITVIATYNSRENVGNTRLSNPQIIQWDKPKTDVEWAEDTKKENIDIRPNKVLDTMIEMHTAKLEREEAGVQKYRDMVARGQDPVQYLYWEWRENFKDSGMTPEEIETESLKQAQEQYEREMGSVEKLQQSVERMENEKRLRMEGFLIVNDPTEEVLMLGASLPEERVRNVIY